jgi:hypothetical protein
MCRWRFCLYYIGTERLLVIPICVLQHLMHAAEYHCPWVVTIGKPTSLHFQHCPCIPITKIHNKMNVVCIIFICELCIHHPRWHKNFPRTWLLNTNYLPADRCTRGTGKSNISAMWGRSAGIRAVESESQSWSWKEYCVEFGVRVSKNVPTLTPTSI